MHPVLTKPERREVEVEAAYVGSQIPDAFIVGVWAGFDEKYPTCPLWVCLSPAFTNDPRPFHGQEPLPRRGRR